MRSLVFAILLAQLPCAQVLSATIAAKGRSDYRIVSGRHPVERFAAQELARYIEKISGVGLPVSAAAVDGPVLSVGRTDVSERAGIRVPSRYQDDDGFVIRSIGDDVVLVGANTRGTLYAVYAFLQSIGCRWYAPNFDLYEGRAEFVPRLSTIEVGPMDVLEQADWRYRKTDCGAILSHTVERWEQIFDWMAKTRRNRLCYHLTSGRKGWDVWGDKLLPGLQKRGLKVEVGKHNAYRVFLPRSVFNEHPEWLGMSAGRRSFAGSLVFCSSNGDALRLLARNAAKYSASHKELAALQLWPPDGDRWCECKRCRALGDPTERHARTVAAVAEAVSKARPEIKVEFLAYSKYTSPPSDMIFPANTILDFAPIGRSFQYDIFEPGAVNERYANALKNWVKEYRGDISIYTYYAKYAWNSLPNNIPHRIAREVKWYASLGIKGMSIYSEPASWLALEQNQYLVSRLLWRNDFDVDGYLDEWRRHRFGGAAEPMREYFRLMEEIVPGACSIPGTAVASLRVLNPFLAKAERCATLLAQAKELAGSDPCARFFIERTQRCLDYVRADLALRQGRLARLPREEMNKRLAALKRILEANAGTGVFCDYSTFERYRSRYAGDKRIPRNDPNWRPIYGKWTLADSRFKSRDGGLAVLLWKKVDSAGRRFAVEVKYEILAESGNRNALIIFGHDQAVDDWYCAGVAAAQGNIIIGRCNRGESRLHVLKSANFDKAKSGSGIMRLLVDFDTGRVGVSLKVADKWASVLDADLPDLKSVQPRIGLGAKGSSCAFSDFTVTPMP